MKREPDPNPEIQRDVAQEQVDAMTALVRALLPSFAAPEITPVLRSKHRATYDQAEIDRQLAQERVARAVRRTPSAHAKPRPEPPRKPRKAQESARPSLRAMLSIAAEKTRQRRERLRTSDRPRAKRANRGAASNT